MGPFGNLSITRKLLVVIIIPSILALLLATAAVVIIDRQDYRDDLVYKLGVLAGVTCDNSIAPLEFADPRAAERTLASLHADPHIVSAHVLGASGEVFASYHRTGQTAAPPPVPNASHAFTNDTLVLVAPIVFEGERLGSVLLEADLMELDARLGRYLSAVLPLLIGVTSLLILMMVAALQRVVSGPILALAQTARQVSQHPDYTVRVEVFGRDEIGSVSASFNEMLEQVHVRDLELQRSRDDLELRVDERTRELVVAKETAEAASRTKSTFLANVSHELRTPLAAIRGSMALVAAGVAGSLTEQTRQLVDISLSNSDRLLKLIENLLDLTSIEAGRAELQIEEVALSPLLHDCLNAVGEDALKKGISLSCSLPEQCPHLRGDPRRIKQSLTNLLRNGIKFTPQDGRVGIEAVVFANEMQICVWDTGSGIEPENRERIFAPFEQEDTTLARRHGGTGLGLSLAKYLVEQQGGRIWLESTPGSGSRFYFTLPLSRPAAA